MIRDTDRLHVEYTARVKTRETWDLERGLQLWKDRLLADHGPANPMSTNYGSTVRSLYLSLIRNRERVLQERKDGN